MKGVPASHGDVGYLALETLGRRPEVRSTGHHARLTWQHRHNSMAVVEMHGARRRFVVAWCRFQMRFWRRCIQRAARVPAPA